MDGGADLDDHTFAHSGPDQGLADALLRALSRPVALSQDRLALSQERLALSQNRRSVAQALVYYGRTAEARRKRKRSSDLLCDKDEIGRRFLVALRLANGCYGWSTSWAREHYPDRCSTQDATKSFLRQARRYAKCVEGVTASSQAVVKASSRAVVKASSQAFPSRRASSQALVAASCTPCTCSFETKTEAWLWRAWHHEITRVGGRALRLVRRFHFECEGEVAEWIAPKCGSWHCARLSAIACREEGVRPIAATRGLELASDQQHLAEEMAAASWYFMANSESALQGQQGHRKEEVAHFLEQCPPSPILASPIGTHGRISL